MLNATRISKPSEFGLDYDEKKAQAENFGHCQSALPTPKYARLFLPLWETNGKKDEEGQNGRGGVAEVCSARQKLRNVTWLG